MQIKLEACNWKNLPILTGNNQLRVITPNLGSTNKSTVMYMCNRCKIYFPIRRLLELHDCKSTNRKPPGLPLNNVYQVQTDSSDTEPVVEPTDQIKIEHEHEIDHNADNDVDDDDENSWKVETLDENLPILAKVINKEKDTSKLNVLRKCPFCSFGSDNCSTYRSHVKRKHYEDWLKSHAKENCQEKRQQVKIVGTQATEHCEVVKAIKKIDKIRSCPYCSFETITKSTLYSHISRSHRGKRSHDSKHANVRRQYNAFAYTGYACSYCTFAAATMSSLKYHTAREHGEQKRQPVIEFPTVEFDCEQCDYKTKSRKNMQHHLKVTHQLTANEEGMFTCHLCSYETLSKMGVQRHISIKHDKPRREAKANAEIKRYACDACNYQTYNAKVLEWHKKQHNVDDNETTDDGNAYLCNDCDFSTWTKGLLLTHIKRNHKVEEIGQEKSTAKSDTSRVEQTQDNYLSCDRCDYTTKNKHVMKVHVIRKHTEGFNHFCELCGKKYKVKADLTNHMRFQHREQPIICDVCGKTCRNSNLLYLHQKFAHYKPEFECHICHRRMVSQANLDDHVLKQHEQRQDVICEECGKTFTRQSRLKIHMRTHLGLRPYGCKICGKSFARRNGLRQHLLIHTGQRPYICDICGKDFTQKTGLISHRKSHPGSHPPLPRVTIDHVLSGLINDDKK